MGKLEKFEASLQDQTVKDLKQYHKDAEINREDEKEEERVKNWTSTKHTENIKKDSEQASRERGHISAEEPAKHSQKTEKKSSEGEKSERNSKDEKKEGFDRKIKGLDIDHIKVLEDELVKNRAAYAEIEYNNRTALESVRKWFGSKNNEDGAVVAHAKDQYLKKLESYKEAKVEELRGKGLKGEALKDEVAELVRKFGYLESVELFNVRKEAKSEKLMGRDVVKKCWGWLEKTEAAYNRLPLWKKVGLSVGAIALGVSLSTGAAATAGVAGLAAFGVGAKRALGGLVAGVGVAKGLDASQQYSMKRASNKTAEKYLAEMTKEGAIDLDKLSVLLSGEINSVDEKLNNQKIASAANKFIGITVGVVLGTGMASKALGAFLGHHEAVNGVAGATAAGVATESVGAQDLHDLTIEKGSSIERTLIDHIKATHGDQIKNPGRAAHRMWLDYMHDNKEQIINKVGQDEYGKMLKDGMVNVKPGTILTLDEHNGLKINGIGGDISHLNGAVSHVAENLHEHVDVADTSGVEGAVDASPAEETVVNVNIQPTYVTGGVEYVGTPGMEVVPMVGLLEHHHLYAPGNFHGTFRNTIQHVVRGHHGSFERLRDMRMGEIVNPNTGELRTLPRGLRVDRPFLREMVKVAPVNGREKFGVWAYNTVQNHGFRHR